MLTKLKQLKSHQGFMRYLANTSWMLGEQMLRMHQVCWWAIVYHRHSGLLSAKALAKSYVGADLSAIG